MTRVGRMVAASLLAASCTEPMVPSRGATYPFADVAGDVFHWPGDRLPVRVYADPRGDLRTLVAGAVGVWERQFLYGEFRGIVVDDSNSADVIVRWTDSVPPAAPPDPGPPAKACGGVTQATIDSTDQALTGPFETEISILSGVVFTPAKIEACVQRTAVHELGHALGLLQHSADPLTIMNATPLVREPSEIDRWTVRVLYHTPATIAPAPRRP